jgi:uncharacterized protein
MSVPPQPAQDRDRGADRRPRNARPRDGLGRPLAKGAVGVGRQPEGIRRSPSQTLAEAQRLLAAGRPFHAHEVFEDAWKATQSPERELWRGLAQLAVGLTHAARGNQRGAASLLRRGAVTIADYRVSPPFGLDVEALLQWVDTSIEQVEITCPVVLSPPPIPS